MNDWQAQALRLTVFRSAPTQEVPPLWKDLTGDQPEKVDAQPRQNAIQEVGTVSFGTLVHVSNPIKIDWILGPSETQQNVPFPILGSFTDVADEFLSLMSRWLVSGCMPDINRIAFGAVILTPKDSKLSAYTSLATFLPSVKLDVQHSSDFLYQINRPLKSQIDPNLEINRLSKWNVIQTIGIGIFVDTKPKVTTSPGNPDFSCRLELDISTSQHHTQTIPKDQLVSIYRELYEFGKNIASQGDQ